MKKIFIYIIVVTLFAISSCTDDINEIGSTLHEVNDFTEIACDTFNVKTQSIKAEPLLAKSSVGFLGQIKDPETGGYITAGYITKFNLLENYSLPELDSIVSKNTEGVYADSCELRINYRKNYGDSLAVMKFKVQELVKPLEENSSYKTNFDFVNSDMIRVGGISKTKTYTLQGSAENETTKNNYKYIKYMTIKLNDTYTDKEGKKYNNYGTYIMRKFFENKNDFKNSYTLAHNVVPGFCFSHAGGLGSMAEVTSTMLNIHFRYKTNDSIVKGNVILASTEEVAQAIYLKTDEGSIQQLIDNDKYTYLKTPSGIYTELELPITSIVEKRVNDSISGAKIVLQRINNEVNTEYSLNVPKAVVMVEKDSLNNFFSNNKLPNGYTSFISLFTEKKNESAELNTYTFNNISTLITHIYNKRAEGMKLNPNWENEHPNWNKVVIVPVATTYTIVDEQQKLLKVEHDMSISSTKLRANKNENDGNVKITVVYNKIK